MNYDHLSKIGQLLYFFNLSISKYLFIHQRILVFQLVVIFSCTLFPPRFFLSCIQAFLFLKNTYILQVAKFDAKKGGNSYVLSWDQKDS